MAELGLDGSGEAGWGVVGAATSGSDGDTLLLLTGWGVPPMGVVSFLLLEDDIFGLVWREVGSKELVEVGIEV